MARTRGIIRVALVAGWIAIALGCSAGTSFDPAGALDLRATIVDTEETTDGLIPVAVQLYQANELVQVAPMVILSCNSQALSWTGLSYAGRVAPPMEGQLLVFVHEREGVVTKAQVKVPARPVITAPQAGAQVQRAPTLQVTYAAGGGASVRAGVVGPAMSRQGEAQPDNGVASVSALDVGAGPGAVTLAREVKGAVNGTGFASVQFTYVIEKRHAVTWQ